MTSALKIDRSKVATAEDLAKAFPDVDPGFEPFGSRVIVQLRCPKLYTEGGIQLTDETVETEMWNTQIGKVRAVGPVAFHNRGNMEPWPEGSWATVGDYVRIPKFNQDKWFMEYPCKIKPLFGKEFDGKERLLFMLINDLDLLARKIGNPLEVKAYI